MTKNKTILLLVIFLVSLISVFDLFHPGLPITHDGQDHVARIANFYKNLQEGILIPRWAANLNWGYGHPILEFLYPLPSYVASLFHGIGFSLIDSTKIIFAIGLLGSAIAMFVWLSEFLPLPAATIGGLLYVFAPYRFVDVYVRGDIGENFAFMFMPLVLFAVYRLCETKNSLYIVIGALGLACLILAHNAIALMFLPFILFYCVYMAYSSPKKYYNLRAIAIMVMFGFGLSAFFWIPGLLEGKYTLRNIVTHGEYAKRFVQFKSLLYGPWSYGLSGEFSLQIGILHWLSVLASSYIIWVLSRKKKEKILLLSLLIYFAIAIFLMIPQSNFLWQRITLLQNFQFPWRFLAIPVFVGSVLGAYAISCIPRRFTKVAIILAVLLILLLNKDYWRAKGFFSKPESFFTGIYDRTTDTGESSPIWSVRFMEHRFVKPLDVIGGIARVDQIKRTSTNHMYRVIVTKSAQFLENTVYFPGWNVFVDGENIPIQYQDPHHRGLITFYVSTGTHVVSVVYTETRLRLISDIISLISILLVSLLLIYDKKK